MIRRTGMRNRVAALAAVTAFAVGVGSIAVLAARSGDNGLQRLPTLGAGSEAGDRAAMASMSAPGFDGVEYVLSGALPDLPAEAPAYRLETEGIDKAAAKRVADALRVTAPVVEEGGRFTAGPLTVEDAPGGPWYLSPVGRGCLDAPVASDQPGSVTVQGCAVATASPVLGCAPDDPTCRGRGASGSVGSSGSAEPGRAEPGAEPDRSAPTPPSAPVPIPKPPVENPTPVADLPSRAEAERIARDIFGALGVPSDSLRLDGGIHNWNATVSPRVAGLEVLGLEHALSIGPKGELQWANGHLGGTERIGLYPLAGVETGFDRLRTGGTGGPMPLSDTGAAEPAIGRVGTHVVTITGVHLALQRVTDRLVPVYVFEAEQGGTFPVPAVADKYLEKAQPSPAPRPDPGIPEPGHTDPGGGAGCSGTAEGAAPGTDNAPLTVEVCVEPTVAKVGQEVVFTLVAQDPDAPIQEDGCGGPTATFGDEEHAVTSQCMPMCAAPRTKPAKTPGKHSVTYRHVYERPGTFTARFAVQSQVCNPYGSRGEATVSLRVH
jgi:hypothetical protein